MLDQVEDLLGVFFLYPCSLSVVLAYCLLLVCSTKLYAEICLHLLVISGGDL
jgi:hypothetical protein